MALHEIVPMLGVPVTVSGHWIHITDQGDDSGFKWMRCLLMRNGVNPIVARVVDHAIDFCGTGATFEQAIAPDKGSNRA